jgi:hypothetical protein
MRSFAYAQDDIRGLVSNKRHFVKKCLRLLTKSAQKLRKLNIKTVEKSTVFLYF